MTLRETAKRLTRRGGDAVRAARSRIHMPKRKSRTERMFDEAKPVLRAAAPMMATVAVEQFLRRWRGANRKKALRQEIAPALAGLAAAAASNPKVRKILKDAIDAALPKLESVVEKTKRAKVAMGEKGEEAVATGGPESDGA